MEKKGWIGGAILLKELTAWGKPQKEEGRIGILFRVFNLSQE